MTREQQLEVIRAKCIKANPEIANVPANECVSYDHMHRSIRLADVLLAIDATRELKNSWVANDFILIATTGRFLTWTSNWFNRPSIFSSVSSKEQARNPDIIRASDKGVWNLRQDDITQQSDQCILFIYDLLK